MCTREGTTVTKWFIAVLVLLSVVGVGRAGENEIIRDLKKSGAYIREPDGPGGRPALAVVLGDTHLDANLAELCELRRLQWLLVCRTNITAARMRTIGGLTELSRLDLGDSVFTDAALKELRGLRKLGILGLTNTNVTDAGLEGLSDLSNLHWLLLDGCPGVTDAGIKSIARLKNLVFVDLTATGVTEAGVARLQNALPGCTVLLGNKVFDAKP
jgi:hypothetical protein